MPVHDAKLRVPVPRRKLLRRDRLANALVGSRGERPRLVLIAAGAGFGKTTLLSQWLAEAGDQVVAWVSLDEGDSEVEQFLTALVSAATRAGDGLGREASAMLGGDRSAAAEDVIASLVADLDQVVLPVVIALDDYHRAESPAVNEAVAFLLESLPPQVTLAITTRADPALPLARLRSRGELVEVRADDLRFTRDEADGFLGTVMDLDLESAHVAALAERTEGWVAGLQLAGLSARAKASSAVGAFVDEFSGSHRFVLDYLVEEVLAAQPSVVQRFLLATSVLDGMTGSLCDALTGGSDGQRMLADLDRANLFLVPLDDERQWYRYHHLFAEALRSRLRAEHPETVAGLHAAASRWHAAHGSLQDAITHAAQGDAAEWLADLVELAIPGLRKERRNGAIVRSVAEVPDDVQRTRAVLACARAWVEMTSGNLTAASEWLDVADDVSSGPMTTFSAQVPQPLLDARAAEVRSVPATVAIYRAAIGQATGDTDLTVAQATRALALAEPTDHLVRGAASGLLGLAAWAAGDLRSAVPTFQTAVEHLGAAGNVTDQLGATVVLASMALDLGDAVEARRLYEEALAAATAEPDAGSRIARDLHVGLADVLREQGDLAGAAEHLRSAEALGDSASFPENRFRVPAAQAGILVAGGEFDAAIELLERAQELYLPGFFPDLRPLPAVTARALIAGGRLAEARTWAETSAVREADPSDYRREFDVLTFARLVLAEHRAGIADGQDLAGAIALVGRVIEAGQEADRPGSVIEAQLMSALLADAAGDRSTAHKDIARALAGGVPGGFRRLFLDEGPAVRTLLADYASAQESGEEVGLARELLGVEETAALPPLPFGIEELSPRELEVLRLLDSDLTGPEIADRLFVSINTLRTHTKHIFTKLDVKTRRAAVTRAAELHLM